MLWVDWYLAIWKWDWRTQPLAQSYLGWTPAPDDPAKAKWSQMMDEKNLNNQIYFCRCCFNLQLVTNNFILVYILANLHHKKYAKYNVCVTSWIVLIAVKTAIIVMLSTIYKLDDFQSPEAGSLHLLILYPPFSCVCPFTTSSPLSSFTLMKGQCKRQSPGWPFIYFIRSGFPLRK